MTSITDRIRAVLRPGGTHEQLLGDVIAEIERLQADAARYRWLRKNCFEWYPSAEGANDKDAYLVITGYDHLSPMNDDQKNDAIDAEMKERR